MPDGEFEVRNRYGDVVQRGEIEVRNVESGRMELGFDDPAVIRHGDQMLRTVEVSEDAMREFHGEEAA